MENYFMISVDGGGNVYVRSGTEDTILLSLKIDGDSGELISEPFAAGDQFEGDPEYWGEDQVLIIKGEIVTPRPVSMTYALS